AGLEVDPPGLAPGANGVFEPGETVDVVPAWSNEEELGAGLTGVATGFSGPGDGLYTTQLADADYGVIPPGEAASCLATDVCYRLTVDDPAIRPARHWDAELEESLDDLDGMVQHWTLHLGDSF